MERKHYATPVEYEILESNKKPCLVLRRSTETEKTVHCPFCGERHLHGKGDGHRLPHCDSHDGDIYEWVDHDGDLTRLYQKDGYIIRTTKNLPKQ